MSDNVSRSRVNNTDVTTYTANPPYYEGGDETLEAIAISLADITTQFQNAKEYNLKDFGAKADALYEDGSNNFYSNSGMTIPATDNYQIFMNAINSLPNGVVLKIPWGRYFFSQEIIISTTKKILIRCDKGNDGGTTLFYIKDTTTGNGLTFKSAGLSIKDLYIQGFDTTKGTGVYCYGESGISRYNTYNRLENVWSVGFKEGFRIADSYLVTLDMCTAAFNQDGFIFNNVTTTLHARQCWAMNNSRWGYNIVSVNYSSFINCACDNNGDVAYRVQSSKGVAFIGVGAEKNLKEMFNVTDSHIHINSAIALLNAQNAAEASFIKSVNSIVSVQNCEELSVNGSSTVTSSVVSDATSITNVDMSAFIFKVYKAPGARIYGKQIIGSTVTDWLGENIAVYRTSVPTTGTFALGDMCVNTAYDIKTSPIKKWICVVAGTPGDWRPIEKAMHYGTTANRPTVNGYYSLGLQYIDTDLGSKLITWNGTVWKDSSGATV